LGNEGDGRVGREEMKERKGRLDVKTADEEICFVTLSNQR
jgi:hypothetical protein